VAKASSIWRNVRRDAVLLGAGSMAAVLTQLIFRSVLISVLVPAAYGRLSLVLSIYNAAWIVGAGGLPSGVARHIAAIAPADDRPVVRSALRAGIWPAIGAAALVAAAAALLLRSPLAFLYGAAGLGSFVYTVIVMGVLRGRGRMGWSSAIMPLGGAGEVLALLALMGLGATVSALSAFGIFCLGNLVGLAVGLPLLIRTAPRRRGAFDAQGAGPAMPSAEAAGVAEPLPSAPSARELLGFSMWLGIATVGIAMLPVAVRFAAALHSYTTVAMVDVALLLLSIPLRIGSVLVSAVVPHATRALRGGRAVLAISRREQLAVLVPFVLAAVMVASTNVLGAAFGALGRPQYAQGAVYISLALLAGPARVLYGVVEGVLVAHGQGRFLALSSVCVTALGALAIFALAALASMQSAFALFVVSCWAVYLFGARRIRSLSASPPSSLALAPSAS
jgi:O-antigen/teichoic acid export membrane protein